MRKPILQALNAYFLSEFCVGLITFQRNISFALLRPYSNDNVFSTHVQNACACAEILQEIIFILAFLVIECDKLGFFKSLQKKDDVGCNINSVQKSGDDFIFNSKSTAKECVPSFKNTKIPKLITLLMDIKLKCKVYDKVNVCIKVIALSDVTEASDSKSSVPYQTATVADSGESRTLTVYAHLINTLEVNKCFKITDLNVVDFQGYKVLKSLESMAIEPSNTIINTSTIVSLFKTITAKITTIHMNSLDTVPTCPTCEEAVTSEDDILFCGNCQTVTSLSNIKEPRLINFSVVSNTEQRFHFKAMVSTMEKLASVKVENQRAFCKQLIGMETSITYNKELQKVSSISRIQKPDVSSQPQNKKSW